MGNHHFKSGGPPCMGCHNVGENGLLGGGALGPDLTNVSTRRSQAEILEILSNAGPSLLPVKLPIYADFPLTAEEQADLVVFLEASAGQTESDKELLVLGISLAGFIASVGSNMSMTRTPDVYFAAEARHNGTKLVVFAPDFNQVAQYVDWWVLVNAGQDGALWMAVNHVIMNEFHYQNPMPFFLDYLRRYSDAPFLVEINEVEGKHVLGRMIRAAQVERTKVVENGEWKFLVWDEISDAPRMPQGSLGFRWQKQKGQWNLDPKDGLDGSEIRPQLTFFGSAEQLSVSFAEFGEGKSFQRSIPVRTIETANGKVPVATSTMR